MANINRNFTLSAPCITIQMSQFEPTNAHNFIKITLLLQHTSSYMSGTLTARRQRAHNCKNSCLKCSAKLPQNASMPQYEELTQISYSRDWFSL